jgi:hypothetical protein
MRCFKLLNLFDNWIKIDYIKFEFSGLFGRNLVNEISNRGDK